MSCKNHCDKASNNKYANIDFDFGIPSRFDLENAISSQMDVCDDLSVIIDDVLDGEGLNLDPDQLANTLQGIINLHNVKYNKLWNTFIHLFRLDFHLDSMYTSEDDNDEEEYHD